MKRKFSFFIFFFGLILALSYLVFKFISPQFKPKVFVAEDTGNTLQTQSLPSSPSLPQVERSKQITNDATHSSNSSSTPSSTVGKPSREPLTEEPKEYQFQVVFNREDGGSLNFYFFQPSNQPVVKKTELYIPPGWEFSQGSSVGQDDVIGQGGYNFILNGHQGSSSVTLVNDQDTKGHKAHWKVFFGDPESTSSVLDGFLDGDAAGGHKMVLERKFQYDIRPPIKFDFTIFGNSRPKNNSIPREVFVPPEKGTFLFREVVYLIDGSIKEFEDSISI